ncbi:MAG: hypothetical protein MHM6MM_007909, partial [Cercozoa sp. M6MM]
THTHTHTHELCLLQVALFVSEFLRRGVPASRIGIVAPLRAQLPLIRESLRHHCSSTETETDTDTDIETDTDTDRQHQQSQQQQVALSTVDRYQGQDKDVIVLSLVSSNTAGRVTRLLTDTRRINVALTRAKCKLVIVGDADTVAARSDLCLSTLVRHVRRRGWLHALPDDFRFDAEHTDSALGDYDAS